jgi:acetyl esterase/lipase
VQTRPVTVAVRALVAVVLMLGICAPSANAALPWRLPLFEPKKPPAPPPIAPVAEPITVDPVGPVKGTMLMVHAGGWAGHDANAQEQLIKSPGDVFLQRGWRLISIDYNEGTAGLQDVLNSAGAELTRKTGDGPLCIYGESSGAHLALVAKLRAIDCLIGLGTPTDLALYQSEATTSPDDRVRMIAERMVRFFGTTPEQIAPWNPVSLAASNHADVLLMHEADDTVVSAQHALRYQAANPTTQVVELEAGDPNVRKADFKHGTVSDVGRARYATSLGAFVDRAVANRDAERAAGKTDCARTARPISEIGLPAMQNALRCLARQDASVRSTDAGRWQQTTVRLRGEVNAARVWSLLRTKASGRLALQAAAQRRVKISVQTSERSRVTLRATRTRS